MISPVLFCIIALAQSGMSNPWHDVHGKQNMISFFVLCILANHCLMTSLHAEVNAE